MVSTFFSFSRSPFGDAKLNKAIVTNYLEIKTI